MGVAEVALSSASNPSGTQTVGVAVGVSVGVVVGVAVTVGVVVGVIEGVVVGVSEGVPDGSDVGGAATPIPFASACADFAPKKERFSPDDPASSEKASRRIRKGRRGLACFIFGMTSRGTGNLSPKNATEGKYRLGPEEISGTACRCTPPDVERPRCIHQDAGLPRKLRCVRLRQHAAHTRRPTDALRTQQPANAM